MTAPRGSLSRAAMGTAPIASSTVLAKLLSSHKPDSQVTMMSDNLVASQIDLRKLSGDARRQGFRAICGQSRQELRAPWSGYLKGERSYGPQGSARCTSRTTGEGLSPSAFTVRIASAALKSPTRYSTFLSFSAPAQDDGCEEGVFMYLIAVAGTSRRSTRSAPRSVTSSLPRRPGSNTTAHRPRRQGMKLLGVRSRTSKKEKVDL